MRACDSWPTPWVALRIPGSLWWLIRLLAYRDLRYAIEHEIPVDEDSVNWPEDEGW